MDPESHKRIPRNQLKPFLIVLTRLAFKLLIIWFESNYWAKPGQVGVYIKHVQKREIDPFRHCIDICNECLIREFKAQRLDRNEKAKHRAERSYHLWNVMKRFWWKRNELVHQKFLQKWAHPQIYTGRVAGIREHTGYKCELTPHLLNFNVLISISDLYELTWQFQIWHKNWKRHIMLVLLAAHHSGSKWPGKEGERVGCSVLKLRPHIPI